MLTTSNCREIEKKKKIIRISHISAGALHNDVWNCNGQFHYFKLQRKYFEEVLSINFNENISKIEKLEIYVFMFRRNWNCFLIVFHFSILLYIITNIKKNVFCRNLFGVQFTFKHSTHSHLFSSKEFDFRSHKKCLSAKKRLHDFDE